MAETARSWSQHRTVFVFAGTLPDGSEHRAARSVLARTGAQRRNTLTTADNEIQQATATGRGPDAADAQPGANLVSRCQRLTCEYTLLKPRVRQLADQNQTFDERLKTARSNARFLDRRIADLETQLLDKPTVLVLAGSDPCLSRSDPRRRCSPRPGR